MTRIFFILVLTFAVVSAQQIPLQKSDYKTITSHAELSQFIKEVDEKSDLIKVK